MKGSLKVKSLFLVMVLVLTMPLSALAHSGRTDSSGGHKDNNNVSGLGPYHYHHGMGPHLHPGGVCPYDSPAPVAYSKPVPTTNYSKPVRKAPEYIVEDKIFYIKDSPVYLKTIMEDGSSLVELRALSEAFYISPEYQKDNNSIFINRMDVGGHRVTFFANDNTIINSNGEKEWLDMKTVTQGGKLYVPLRAFTDQLGYYVVYMDRTFYIS